jgi:hypothetical protein
MFKSFDFCLPTKSTTVPDGPDWLHEVKYDGYRLLLERDGDRIRLITRGGYNWTDRYPLIVEAARKIRQKRFVLDGEAVILGVEGISDFNALHSRCMTMRSSSAPSISSLKAAMICASCRYQCARPTLNGCWREGRKASSSIHSSVARSVLTFSGPPATWALKVWCRSVVIGPIRLAGQSIGSK